LQFVDVSHRFRGDQTGCDVRLSKTRSKLEEIEWTCKSFIIQLWTDLLL